MVEYKVNRIKKENDEGSAQNAENRRSNCA